jgi:ribonuclease BN (tRNA processing enzyme)
VRELLFGCGTHAQLAVVDSHEDLVDDYIATAASLGAPIVAVFETHVQADHISGLPALVERSGATAYLEGFQNVGSCCGAVVFVDQSAESVAALDLAGVLSLGGGSWFGRAQCESAVGALAVVVGGIDA